MLYGELSTVITFLDTNLLGFVFSDNNISYTQTISSSKSLVNFDSVVSDNIDLNISNTTITISNGFDGCFFHISETDGQFNFDQLIIYDLTPPDQKVLNSFSIFDLWSGKILLRNSFVKHLTSNAKSLIYISCFDQLNASLTIQDSRFIDVNLDQTRPYPNAGSPSVVVGIVHLSNLGGSTACSNDVTINNVTFSRLNYHNNDISTVQSSAIMIDYEGDFSMKIVGSTFADLSARNGPALNVQASNVDDLNTPIDIQDSLFENTTSFSEGGAIYCPQKDIRLVNNNFTLVKSLTGNGGALYLNSSENNETITKFNTFENVARYSYYTFSDSSPLGTAPVVLNITFESEKPLLQEEDSDGIIVLSNFSSYDFENVVIKGLLLDDFDQIVYDISSVKKKSLSISIGDQIYDARQCENPECNITKPDIYITAAANENVLGQIYYESPIFDISPTDFYVKLRHCIDGEINTTFVNPSNPPQCIPCPEGKYSLDVLFDKECYNCPTFAYCYGRNNISLYSGYWRENISTIAILPCPNSEACKGGFDSECEPGYRGYLCNSCDGSMRWVKSKDTCSLCPTPGRSLLISVILLIATLGYQLWFIKATRISNSFFIAYFGNKNDTVNGMRIEMRITQGMYIRLLTTYSQIGGIISTFQLNFSQLFDKLQSSTQTIANPTSTLFYSSECSFLDLGLDPNRTLYYKVNMAIILPLLKLVGLFIFRMLYWRFQVNEKRKAILVVTAICLFLLEQPGIAQELFSVLNCVQIGSTGKYFIQQDIGYECYTPEYYTFRNFYVIPALIFYAILLPALIFGILFKNRNRIDDTKLRMNLGVIYNEYHPRAYFWGCFLVVTKIVLMYLGSTLSGDIKTKGLSVLVVLYIYYALYIKFHPYERQDLFEAERITLISFLFTIFGSIYYKDNTLQAIQWLTLLGVVLLNAYVLGLLIWKITKIYLFQMRDMLLPLMKSLKRTNTLDIDFSGEDFLASQDFRTSIIKKEKEEEIETLADIEERIFGKVELRKRKVKPINLDRIPESEPPIL